MSEATVSGGYAKALFDLAVSKGADPDVLMAQSEIAASDLEDRDARIKFSNFVKLMRAGKALSGDEALALHFGAAKTLNELSIVGLIAYSVDTIAEAWAQVNRYGRLVIEVDGVGDGDRFQFQRDHDGTWLVDTRDNPNVFPELTESGWARMICGFSAAFSEVPFARAVECTHAEPNYADEYERLLKVPVKFDCNRNAILINDAFMQLEITRADRYVFGILSEHAKALMAELEQSKTVRGRAESLMMPQLHTGDLSMDAIAEEMGLSRPTLYRKLKTEGVTYETVLDELRHTMALHYLSGEKVSVNETAYLVGFSDPSAFSRAFKRWTGQTPGQIRAGV